ncbi:MAG: Wzz/FepE/Etk N-terminal domain-containing protein [Oscillospiraceae bacterium]|nr:Wzz/FepE/Etk N-terminal domain-containing protein [Oscillospiraceae bacterium]
MQEQEDTEIDLGRLFRSLKKHWYLLLGGLAAGAVIAGLISLFCMPKLYTSTATMYVYTSSKTERNITTMDLETSQKLAFTYIVILKDTDVMQQVADRLSQPISVQALKNAVSVSAVNETEVLSISASTESPQFSAEVCNTIARIAPDVLKRVVKAGSAELISAAKPAGAPSSPDVEKNTLIGALAGFIIVLIICIVKELTDKRIQTAQDLARLNLPILGEIPEIRKRRRIP